MLLIQEKSCKHHHNAAICKTSDQVITIETIYGRVHTNLFYFFITGAINNNI